jgi:hypothetical protein
MYLQWIGHDRIEHLLKFSTTVHMLSATVHVVEILRAFGKRVTFIKWQTFIHLHAHQVLWHSHTNLKSTTYLPGFSGFPTGASTVMLLTTSCAGILTSSTSHSIPK